MGLYNFADKSINAEKFKDKHIAIFFGCDIHPNFIHLFYSNLFNNLSPSEISIFMLSHNKENHHYAYYSSLFPKLIHKRCNVILFDDFLFNISLKDLPKAIWSIGFNSLETKDLPFRKMSLYDLISTIVEPISLFKKFNVDYLFINPFIKELYNIHDSSFKKKFVYNEILNIKSIPKLDLNIELNGIEKDFLYYSLIPFTQYKHLTYNEFLDKYNDPLFLPELKSDLNSLVKEIHTPIKKSVVRNLSGEHEIIDIMRNFSTLSKIEILKLLKNNLTLSQISKKINLSISTVKSHLDDMEKEGLIYKTFDKKYYLISDEIVLNIKI